MSAFDVSGMRSLASDLGKVPARKTLEVRQTIVKGAVKIKDAMREDMAASESFGALARNIGFDLYVDRSGIRAEIGVASRTGGAGSSGLGFGANIAYFGGPRGGGGVTDPVKRLDEEAPEVARNLGDLLGDVF